MAHARATIGTTNYAVAIAAGHHQLNADESPALGGKDTGPAPFDLLCSVLRARRLHRDHAAHACVAINTMLDSSK